MKKINSNVFHYVVYIVILLGASLYIFFSPEVPENCRVLGFFALTGVLSSISGLLDEYNEWIDKKDIK